MTRTFSLLATVFIAIISTSCSDGMSEDYEIVDNVEQYTGSTMLGDLAELTSQAVPPTLENDTTVFYDFNGNLIEVIIKFPKDTTFKGTILALPGWNYPNSGWCEETELCEKALAQGYALILPEMGKSIYCDSVFPETRKDWLKYPTRAWIKETMIPNIQRDFQLLETSQENFVMGLSTGARGAVLLAMDLPEIFSACGALSGDFDQTRYTKDKLYNGYYGPFEEFQDRWVGNDNAISSISKLTIPVYLAHGKEDNIVPIDYSQQLFLALQESGNEACVLNVNPTAGHDYDFWNSEVDAVLAYFEKYRSK
jgi:esterase/lipase superfamily enzyme